MKLNLNYRSVCLSVIGAALIVSCGKNNAEVGGSSSGSGVNSIASSNSIQGTWGGFPEMYVDIDSFRITFNVRLRFDSNSVTNLVTCRYGDGTVLNTEVSAPAVISNSSIRVLSARENTTRAGGKSCRASIDAGELGYQLQNDVLLLTWQNQTLSLRRM